MNERCLPETQREKKIINTPCIIQKRILPSTLEVTKRNRGEFFIAHCSIRNSGRISKLNKEEKEQI